MRNEQNGLAGENNRLYKIWHSMVDRCNNPSHRQYADYGGRGISVDPRWVRFSEFCEWAFDNGHDGVKTIDRINNDGNYSPENCRWASKKEQARNRRDNVLFEYQGQSKTLPEWAEQYGIKTITLVCRVKRMGWSMERALTEKVAEKDVMITSNGKTQRLSQWAVETGLSRTSLYLRIKRGMDPDVAMSRARNAKK